MIVTGVMLGLCSNYFFWLVVEHPAHGGLLGLLAHCFGSGHHRLHLLPNDVLSKVVSSSCGPKAAVCASDDAFCAESPGIGFQTLSNKPRMLNVRGRGVHNTRHENFVFRDFEAFPNFVLVSMPWIASLNGDILWICRDNNICNFCQWNVMMMWAWIIAPANMHARSGFI